jgi:uncharacterized protein YqjF (DUF2071 family)
VEDRRAVPRAGHLGIDVSDAPKGYWSAPTTAWPWMSLTPFLITSPAAGRSAEDSPRTHTEANLRTYVRRADGREGIGSLFRDVPSAAMLAARSVVGAPYVMQQWTTTT